MGFWWTVCVLSFILISSEGNSIEFLPDLDISLPYAPEGRCRADGELVRAGLRNDTLWAARMWDATGQGSAGALYGNTWHFGMFDECMEIGQPLSVQYCLVRIHISDAQSSNAWKFVEETIRDRRLLNRDDQHTGVCVPSSCTPADLELAFNTQLAVTTDRFKYNVTVVADLCTSSNESNPWTASEITFGIFIAVLVLAAVCGTILGSTRYGTSCNRCARTLCCFSISQNCRILFDGKRSEMERTFAIFHGVKVISMVIVLFGHRSGVPLGAGVANYQNVETFQSSIFNVFFTQADLVVDTFFFVSGVLSTTFVFSSNSKRTITPLQAVIGRITRIAPAYYLIIWMQATVGHRMGSGPLWKYIQKFDTENCQNYWWSNVLFFNNYLPTKYLCLIHSWYLGCDIHFFLITFPLVWLLTWKPQFGKLLLAALIAATPLLPAYAVYKDSLDPLILFYDGFHTNPRLDGTFANIYVTSHMRITVYLMGVSVAYFLITKDLSKYYLSKMGRLGCIGVGTALLLAPVAIGGTYYSEAAPAAGSPFNAAYAALRRPTWAMGLTVFLFLHRFSPKTFVTTILSSRAILVLSKLTYTMYLVHFPLIVFSWASVRSPQTVTVFNLFQEGAGVLLITTAVSAVIFVTVELPIKRFVREVIYSKKLPVADSQPKLHHPQEVVTIKF